jgi:hypothetical protein
MARKKTPKKKTSRKRRTKAELDPALVEKLLVAIKAGAGKRSAAAHCGISERTIHTYEALGRKALTKPEADRTERDQLFADFVLRLDEAQEDLRITMLQTLQKAAGKDWRAGAWLLEKVFPKDYGNRVEVGLEHSGQVEVKRDLSKLTVEELFQLRELTKKIEGGDDDA